MKISAKRLQLAKEENNKSLLRFKNLLEEKKRTLEVYGYEEENETVERYEYLVKTTKETIERLNKAVLLDCGNYEF